jgi:hypothetical protein
MAELNWSDEKVDNPFWIEALAEARLIAAAGETCYKYPLAITAVLISMRRRGASNRDYLLP